VTKVKHIPIEIDHEEETLELMGRYDFSNPPKAQDWSKLQSHIDDQLNKLPDAELVVLLYFRTPKKEG
jgi:hypothetical protein